MTVEEDTFSLNIAAQDTFNPDDPWADDLLQRSEVAKDYTKILKNVSSPAVISINASYGKGKTFFLKRWIAELNKAETVIYFNAWHNDYTSEPLVAFALEFNQALQEMGIVKEETLKSLGQTAQNIAAQLFLAGGKIVTLGALDFKKLKEDEWEDFLAKQSSNIAQAQVEAHLNLKSSILAFEKHLSEICEEIKAQKGSLGLPIYIFIDELDRCRPTFSIEFLEVIKHYFNVPGLIFVIAMDNEQLQHSIKAVYGQGFDGQGYLRRFIDLELALPTAKCNKYVNKLFYEHGITEKYPDHHSLYNSSVLCADFYTKYAEFFDLSLRDIQRGMNTISVALQLMSNKNQIFYPPILAFLVAARQRDIKFYERIGKDLKKAAAILEEAESIANKPDYFNSDDSHVETLAFLLITVLVKNVSALKEEADPIFEKYDKINKAHDTPDVMVLKKQKNQYMRAISLVEDMGFRFNIYSDREPIFYIKEKIDVGARY